MMNGFSTGRDVKIDIVDPSSAAVLQTFSLQTTFESRQMTNRVTIKGLDGIVRYLELPEGWEGSLEYDRQNDALDAYVASLETAYYAGLNLQTAQITETIANPDGSTSIYRFTGVVFKLSNSGSWKGDDRVAQKLDWCASLRIKVQ